MQDSCIYRNRGIMKFIISDKEEVQQAIQDILLEPYKKNAEEWSRLLEDEGSSTAKEFSVAVKKLFKIVEMQQEKGEKDEITFFNIHYLRSSLLDDSFQLVMNLYSPRYYFDPIDTEVCWCPDILKKYYYDDIKYLEERITRMNIIISRQELQVVKQKHYFDYLLFLPKFCQHHINKLIETEEFKKIKISEDFVIQYGEYMGPMMPLYAKFSQERIDEILHN